MYVIIRNVTKKWALRRFLIQQVCRLVWDKDGVFNIEEFDPDPFMDMLNQYGLPWVVDENPQTVE